MIMTGARTSRHALVYTLALLPVGLLPVYFGNAGLVYGASFVGQGLGSEQMYFLRHSLVEAIDGQELEETATAPTARRAARR